MRELVEAMGISHGTVISILRTIGYEKAIGKMGVAFVVDAISDRVTISKQCFEMFQRNPDEFLYRFIIVDETWIYFTSETKEQNNEFHRVNQLRRRRRS